MTPLHEILKWIRRDADLSLKDVSDKLGISNGRLAVLEKQYTRLPEGFIVKWITALDLPKETHPWYIVVHRRTEYLKDMRKMPLNNLLKETIATVAAAEITLSEETVNSIRIAIHKDQAFLSGLHKRPRAADNAIDRINADSR